MSMTDPIADFLTRIRNASSAYHDEVVMALTSGGKDGAAAPSPLARVSGYLCLAVSGLLVLYGLYLIIPQFH